MIQISHKAKATLETQPELGYDLYALVPIVSRLLNQAGAEILSLDLGLEGECFLYRTTLGDVSLARADFGTLCVTCDTLRRGDREVGRQICFQLCKRLISRCPIRVVHWHATRQRLAVEQFSWGRLQDLPQRFARPAIQVVAAASPPSAA